MSVLLQTTSLSRSFPGVRALWRVDFDVRAGEVHALMGQNGAGKSTLVKIITGVQRADTGEMRIGSSEARLFAPASTAEARRLGVAAVQQEVGLIPALSVAENLMLGDLPRRWWGVDWGAARRRAREMLARLGVEIDVSRALGEYPVAVRQMVSIARAVGKKPSVLVLDEPTSSLHGREVERLFEVVRGLRAAGVGIVFITHFLDQVYQVSDRITVLRNGEKVGTWEAKEVGKVELVELMLRGERRGGKDGDGLRQTEEEVGREALTPTLSQKTGRGGSETMPALRVRGVGCAGVLKPFDLNVASGEVVGLAGLLGSGRTEAAELVFGTRERDGGTVEIDGRLMISGGSRAAIDAGMGMCPEDRKADGIIPGLSVRDNIVLVARRGLTRRKGWGLGRWMVRRRAERELANRVAKRLGVRAANLDVPMRTLSGGNQQKAILARWVANDPRLLILDEPTRGVDVGGKAEIAEVVRGLARDGVGVVFISGELEEVAAVADQAVVFRDRAVVGEVTGDRLSERELMTAVAGECEMAKSKS